jgi:hypothetical protein
MATVTGTFQFKVKSYDNEEGEYSPLQQAEPGTIIQFVLNHWFNEMLPNNLDIIVIKNEKGDLLVIDHENKDVFRFFLIPTEKGLFYFYKMTDIRFMFFTLEHFFSGLLDTLKENLNKTMDDWRWVKGDFIGKNFHYSITGWNLFKLFLAPIGLTAALLLFALITPFVDLDSTFRTLLILTGVLAFFYSFSTIRNIMWYLDQRPLQVQLSRGDRFIHVWFNGQKQSIPKTDIVSIQQHLVTDMERDIWWPLFTQLDFQNGDTLNINKLLMPQRDMKDKFFQERDIFRELQSNKKGIQKRTSLPGYFPKRQSHRNQYLK